MKPKTIIAYFAAVIIAAAPLASCSRTTPDTPTVSAAAPESSSAPVVYNETAVEIDFAASNYQHSCADDRIYFTSAETAVTATQILSVAADGTDEKHEWTHTPNADAQTTQFPSQYAVDEDGNLWVIIESAGGNAVNPAADAREYELVKFAPDGTEALHRNLSELDETSGFDVFGILTDSAGNVYLDCENGASSAIFVFSGDGEYLFSARSRWRSDAAKSGDGRILYSEFAADGVTISALNAATKSVDSSVKYNGRNTFYEIFDGRGEFDLHYIANGTLYGLTLETMTETPLVDFADSNIDAANITRITPIAAAAFLIAKIDTTAPEKSGLFTLAPNHTAVPTEKQTLTLATVSDAQVVAILNFAVRNFNAASADTRIEIIDYGAYNTDTDKTLGALRLDLDILNGNAPDIISLGDLPAKKYASKGVFADLMPYLDNDARIDRADLFENVLAQGILDGKLHHVIPTFGVMTLVGKTSVFGTDCTLSISDILDLQQQYPDAALVTEVSALQWLLYCTRFMLNDVIDWDTAACNFENSDFIALLRSAETVPTDYSAPQDFGAYYAEHTDRLRENRALLMLTVADNPRIAREAAEAFGEDVTFLGFPAQNATGGVISPIYDFAITEASPNKDAAWEFISATIRSSAKILPGSTSILKSDLAARLAVEMTPLTERDFSRGVIITRSTALSTSVYAVLTASDDVTAEYANYHITPTEADTAMHVIETAASISSAESAIMQIVREECEIFLAGAQSPEQTAHLIQIRAALYLAESA